MSKLVVVSDLRGNCRKLERILEQLDSRIHVPVFIGNIEGEVLLPEEQLQYRFAPRLGPAYNLRLENASEILAEKGPCEQRVMELAEFYLRYLGRANGENEGVCEKRIVKGLEDVERTLKHGGFYNYKVLSSTFLSNEYSPNRLMDFSELGLDGLVVKGIGMDRDFHIRCEDSSIPEEFQCFNMKSAEDRARYLESFDIFVTNKFSKKLQRYFGRKNNKIILVPGDVNDDISKFTDQGNRHIVIPHSSDFAVYEVKGRRLHKTAYWIEREKKREDIINLDDVHDYKTRVIDLREKVYARGVEERPFINPLAAAAIIGVNAILIGAGTGYLDRGKKIVVYRPDPAVTTELIEVCESKVRLDSKLDNLAYKMEELKKKEEKHKSVVEP